MIKTHSRILALLLTLTLLVQLFSGSVFAEPEELEPTGDPGTSQNGTVEPEAAAELEGEDENSPDPLAKAGKPSTVVVGEVTALRAETQKHFRMEDGSYIAVDYGIPVHYTEDDGESWEEIDNTLVFDNESGFYRSANGNMVKTFASELAPNKTLLTSSWENYMVSMSLFQVASVDSSNTNNDHTNTDQALSNNDETSQNTARVTGHPVDRHIANVSTIQEASSISEQVELSQYNGAILYPGFLPNIDLRYDAYGYNIKESIIINTAQEKYSYSFFLELSGLTPTLQESGAIVFSNESGKEIYMIPAPYMIDDNGVLSDAVWYSLEPSTGGYLLTVTADTEWINSESRSFPVTVDPTLVLLSGSTQDDITSIHVKQQYPSNNYNGSNLYMGNNGGSTKNYYAYLYFENLPAIPANSSVIGASFSLYKMGFSSVGLSKFYGQVHEVTEDMPSTYSTYRQWIHGITWDTAPTFSNTVEASAELYSTGGTGMPIEWDISRLVCKWYDENTLNRTIAITPYSPSTFSSNCYAWAAFYSYTNSPTHCPRFYVHYRNNVGLKGHYTYQSVPAGRAGTGYIGDYTSQPTLANTIVNSPSNTLPFSITAYYNSANRNTYFTDNEAAGIHSVNYTNMKVGAGWKLSIQESIRQITIATNDVSFDYYVYNDSDGSEHYFLKTGQSSPYQDEDGLGLELTVNGTTFTLTDQKDNQKIFYNGYLGKIVDSNGNAIWFLYNGKEYYQAWQPTSGTANYVSKIVRVNNNGSAPDVVTTLFTFTYSGGFLQSIKNAENRSTTLGYQLVGSYQQLFRFTYPDGNKAEYAYSTDGSMLKAFDCEAMVGIGFDYRTFLDTKRVWKVREIAATDINSTETVGNRWHLWVFNSELKEIRFYGLDQMPNTPDDIITRYTFDYTGKTVTAVNYDSDKKRF